LFFQAEDGIRDRNVTGVQTCALPIFFLAIAPGRARSMADRCVLWTSRWTRHDRLDCWSTGNLFSDLGHFHSSVEMLDWLAGCKRSEERRVGKDGGVHMWVS